MTINMADEMSSTGNFLKTEDIFDEDGDDDIIASKEWGNVQSALTEGGFREGLTSGKESKLQNGFNEGFKDAAQTLYSLSMQRGDLSARLSIQGSEEQDESSSEDLQKNLDRTRKLEKDLINASKNQSVEEMKVLKNQQF